jgi:regulator of PEP synthase PpsR (kinase-PPPase family)
MGVSRPFAIHMPSPPSHRKALLGDTTEGNLSEMLDQIKAELGGDAGLAATLAKHLKDGNANPYLQSRAFQTVVRIMDKVDARRGGEVQVLSDEELEEEVMKACVRFLVPMPQDLYDRLLADVQGRRDAHAAREAKVRLARENAARPVDALPGVEKSPLA